MRNLDSVERYNKRSILRKHTYLKTILINMFFDRISIAL